MIQAYPLQWPLDYKRTPNRKKTNAQFTTTFASARDNAIEELRKMGAKNIIISSNIPLRGDGLPRAVPYGNPSAITDDTGIAVYFDFGGEKRVLCCDAFICLDDNMQAIRKTIEALRGIERWQVSEMLNRTFTGFKALPETIKEREWYDVLEVSPFSTEVQIKDAYRRMAMKHHPDKGGNPEQFKQIQTAYEQGMAAVRKRA